MDQTVANPKFSNIELPAAVGHFESHLHREIRQAVGARLVGWQRIGHDIPMLRKDGSVFLADVTRNEIELDGRRCTVGFFRDKTKIAS